ncbi:MAG: hypothetical protein M1831_004794 [Alyxoria varia]|nr:MAG: hypothetical protein M1831_004794 [Alyxoria varia]
MGYLEYHCNTTTHTTTLGAEPFQHYMLCFLWSEKMYRFGSTSLRRTLNLPTPALTRPFTTARPNSLHATKPKQRDHHFDTWKFTQRLQAEGGLSEAQSIALMRVLSDIISESMSNLTRTIVTREDAIKSKNALQTDFNALRSELLTSLESSEAAVTRNSYERLSHEIQKLNQRLEDEMGRTMSGFKLDMNLEKGRIREENVALESRQNEVKMKIRQEVDAVDEKMTWVKHDTLKWVAGFTSGTAALLLGAWRLFM